MRNVRRYPDILGEDSRYTIKTMSHFAMQNPFPAPPFVTLYEGKVCVGWADQSKTKYGVKFRRLARLYRRLHAKNH